MLPFTREQFAGVFADYNTAVWPAQVVAYHGLFFARINPAALAFGALFVVQGVLFLIAGVVKHRLVFAHSAGFASAVGWALVVYAGVLYPLLGQWSGHVYPAQPTFGITPCPVTLFSFGVLLLTSAPVPRWLLIIPLAWSLVGAARPSRSACRRTGPCSSAA